VVAGASKIIAEAFSNSLPSVELAPPKVTGVREDAEFPTLMGEPFRLRTVDHPGPVVEAPVISTLTMILESVLAGVIEAVRLLTAKVAPVRTEPL
jgi:hypothetical protein